MNKKAEYSAYIGIDWADKKHDVCIDVVGSHRVFEVISSNSEAIDEWITRIHDKYPGQLAIAVELTKGPIVYALQKYEYVTIFPVNPLMLARYREAFSLSGAKDDPTDAELAVNLLLKYPKRIKPLQMQSVEMRKLAFLVEQRRNLVDDKCRLSNRIINALKQYYPQPLTWFAHRDTLLFCAFLIKWPTLDKLKRARPSTMIKFISAHTHGGRAMGLIPDRLQAIKSSLALTTDEAVIDTHSLMTVSLCHQLQAVIHTIAVFDEKIESLYHNMPDAPLYEALPGAGQCLAPRLLVAMGEDRARFSNAAEIQKLTGIAPVTRRSGKQCWVHWRWQCSKFLRQSFIEWADKSRHSSYWAGLYYQQQRSRGKTHQAAVRALSFKWIRILFRCWKTRTKYNETKYLKALKERQSPLLDT